MTETFTREQCNDVLRNAGCLNSDSIVLQADANGVYYRFEFGTGDNLLKEDIDAGYNDYIEVQGYEDPDCEIDSNVDCGGEYMFNNTDIPDDMYHVGRMIYDAFCVCNEIPGIGEGCPAFRVVSFQLPQKRKEI